ncbi:hypothetical protein, partial [Streptococcus pneumoniae]|uniref:hypothetical protein n=1 Tax=Streptococcus pneumoniae TaxID=1313 RepID=UPI0012D70810
MPIGVTLTASVGLGSGKDGLGFFASSGSRSITSSGVRGFSGGISAVATLGGSVGGSFAPAVSGILPSGAGEG